MVRNEYEGCNRAAALWKKWKTFWESQKEFQTGSGCNDRLPVGAKGQRTFQEAAADWGTFFADHFDGLVGNALSREAVTMLLVKDSQSAGSGLRDRNDASRLEGLCGTIEFGQAVCCVHLLYRGGLRLYSCGGGAGQLSRGRTAWDRTPWAEASGGHA